MFGYWSDLNHLDIEVPRFIISLPLHLVDDDEEELQERIRRRRR